MGRLKFTLTNAWFYGILVMTCFFCENVPMLYDKSVVSHGFTSTSTILISISLLIMILVYFFFEHKENHLKVDFVLLPILVLLFATSCVAIWSNPSEYFFDVGYRETYIEITDLQKLQATLQIGATLIFTYIFVFAYGRGYVRSKKLLFFNYGFLLVMLFALGYSLFTEMDIYKAILEGKHHAEECKSFFTNRNIYSIGIMCAVFALYTINAYKRKWWTYPLMLLFFIEEFFVRTSTVFLILTVALFLFAIIDICCAFKKHIALGATLLILLILLVFGIALFFAIGQANNNEVILRLLEHLNKNILDKDYDTITNRTKIWEAVFKVLGDDSFRLVFGYGKYIEKDVIRAITGSIWNEPVNSAHNGYIELILKGGIILLSVYILACLYCLYVCVRLIFKGKVKFGFTYLVCFIGVLTHSMSESTHVFGSTISCIFETFIVFLPPIFAYKHMKHPTNVEYVRRGNFWQNTLTVQSMTKVIALVILSVLAFLGLLYAFYADYMNQMLTDIVVFLIFESLVSLIFMPYLVALWHRWSTYTGYRLTLVFWLIGIYGLPILVCILLAMNNNAHPDYYLNYIKYLAPLMSFIMMVPAFITSILTKDGSAKGFFKHTFRGIFSVGGVPLLGLFLTYTIIYLCLYQSGDIQLLDIVLAGFIALEIYYLIFMIMPSKECKKIREEISYDSIYRQRVIMFKEVNSL